MLHASGRQVPVIISYLKSQLKEEDFEQLQSYHGESINNCNLIMIWHSEVSLKILIKFLRKTTTTVKSARLNSPKILYDISLLLLYVYIFIFYYFLFQFNIVISMNHFIYFIFRFSD